MQELRQAVVAFALNLHFCFYFPNSIHSLGSEQSLTELQPLSPAEQRDLEAAESEIERGLESFLSVGKSLLRIKEGRLYRKQAKTFAEYVETRWGFSVAKSYLLTQSVEVVANLKRFTVQPTAEHQVRPLATLEPEQQREVWKEACRLTGGEVPTFAQVNEIRKELFPESFKGRKKPNENFETPEDWLSRGQEIVKEQRESDYKLASWYLEGENRFSQADKLIEEVNWVGPSVSSIKRAARVVEQVKGDKPLQLPFSLVEAAVSLGKADLLTPEASEVSIQREIKKVRALVQTSKQQAETGQELEPDELTQELLRYWPRIYGGILNHFGSQHEARILAFIKEAIHDREFALRGQ